MIEYREKTIWIVSFGATQAVAESELELENITYALKAQGIQYITKEETIKVPVVINPPIIEGKLFGGGLV